MRLLVDENVPSSVSDLLHARGYEVILGLDRFTRGTADDVIAKIASDDLHAVVVTWNHRHFKARAAKTRKNGQPSYPGMGILVFTCEEAIGRKRLEEFLHLIEAEHEYRKHQPDTRVLVEIGPTYFRVLR
jgi:hypothetical protein